MASQRPVRTSSSAVALFVAALAVVFLLRPDPPGDDPPRALPSAAETEAAPATRAPTPRTVEAPGSASIPDATAASAELRTVVPEPVEPRPQEPANGAPADGPGLPMVRFASWQQGRGNPAGVLELRLTGEVVDARGNRVAGARILVDAHAVAHVGEQPPNVHVSPATVSHQETEVGNSDAAGRFDIRFGLPLTFRRAAMAWLEVTAATRYARSPAGEVEWHPDARQRPLRLEVPDAGTVSAKVVTPAGDAVAKVLVRCRSAGDDGEHVANAISDEFGRVVVGNLAPGTYTLRVDSDRWEPVGQPVAAAVLIATESAAPIDLVVRPRRRVELRLRATARELRGVEFRGRFVRPDGSEVAIRRKAYDTGLLRLLDPPADARLLLLESQRYATLRIPLPDIRGPGVHDLGEFLPAARAK